MPSPPQCEIISDPATMIATAPPMGMMRFILGGSSPFLRTFYRTRGWRQENCFSREAPGLGHRCGGDAKSRGRVGGVVHDWSMNGADEAKNGNHGGKRGGPTGGAGSWYLVGLGIGLAVVGGVFCGLMWRSYDRARRMHAWPEVPCVILQSEVLEKVHDAYSPMQYQLSVAYGYEVDGEAFTGERIGLRGNPWTTKRGVVEAQAEALTVGTRTTCRVDPANPEMAVLKPDSKAPGYSIWFPALFVVGGLGVAVRAGARLMADRGGPEN